MIKFENNLNFKNEEKELVEVYKDIEEIIANSPVEEDMVHSKLTEDFILRLKSDADLALRIAGRSHDIERGSKNRVKRDDYKTYDEYKREHSLTSAKIVGDLLEKHNFPSDLIGRVRFLVENHEIGGDSDVEILKIADSLAFFSYNIPFYLRTHSINQVREKIKFMYSRLSAEAQDIIDKIEYKDEEIRNLVNTSISEV